MTSTSDFSDRLTGTSLPSVALNATDGTKVALSTLAGLSVLYAYPRTSPPDGTAIPGWDEIPGAKGCTPRSCGFRDHHKELTDLGVARVFGLSVQDTAYQTEARDHLRLPFEILSDQQFALTHALNLPTFEAGGMTLLERWAMVIENGTILKIFHPITSPGENAKDLLAFLANRA